MSDDFTSNGPRVGGLDVLFVMATEQEYGTQLRSRIKPLMCGVGPVESAIATTSALSLLERHGALPDLVCTLGSAGSSTLDHAEVYQVATVAYRDMDASAFGFERGVTPFCDQPAVITITHRIDGVAAASLSTGASVVSGDGYASIDADMVDMETHAVLRAAQRFGVPVIGLRGISDGRTTVSRFEDWTEYLQVIDAKLAAAIDRFEHQVRQGRFGIVARKR